MSTDWNPTPPETEIFADRVPPRFVRGLEKEGPEVPAQRWKETKEWRAKDKIDTILDEPQPHYENIKSCYQHGYCGHSKDGRVVYYERPGLSNLARLKELNIDAAIQTRHFLFISESCWRVLSPDQDSTLVTVYDVEGLGMSDVAGEKLELFKAVSKIYQAHYVERSGMIVIINTGFWFRMAWKLISPFIHPNTRAKIRICGSDYHATLEELIAKDQLPSEYGGAGPSLMQSGHELRILSHVRAVLAAANANPTA